MSDIQQARGILAKWRDHATPGPWSREEVPETGENRVVREFEFFGSQIEPVAPGGLDSEDARLIVGTAGNPDLLDAIDTMLRDVNANSLYPSHHSERVAAAIIAADERMNS